MKIAFLSSLDPTNIHNWSGTLFHIYKAILKKHEITWIGHKELMEVYQFHTANILKIPFVPEEYTLLLGKLLSDRLQNEYYDLIICRDSFLYAYLITEIPLIFIGDTTFRLFNDYLNIKNSNLISLSEKIEQAALQKAERLFLSSEWAKESAVKDYQVDQEKIHVIEFGANIKSVSAFKRELPSITNCNLLFIGTNWRMKGGNKALETYNILTRSGIHCTLTIVGSKPAFDIEDKNIKVYPFIDKATKKGQQLFQEILIQSHFLILPTLFDCYGIAFCEAAAFGIPSLTSNIGGVNQIVKNGQNGFLFDVHCEASEYADKIMEIITNELYETLTLQCKEDFKKRLNWNVWYEKFEEVLNELMLEKNDTYIPVYVINMKDRIDRKNHILKEFEGKKEFEVTIIEACTHENGSIGLWNSIIKVIHQAQKNEDDIIIICEDDHYFTEHYSSNLLLREIQEAYMQGADFLSGGIGGFGHAVRVGYHRYWIDWFWCTQFVVIYKHFFDIILNYEFKENDTADGVFSKLSANKMVIYPFISEQKDFGYSDVTQSNMDNQGRIREHFAWANKQFNIIRTVEEKIALTLKPDLLGE